MRTLLCTLVQIYVFAVFARVLFSWIPLAPDSPVTSVRRFIIRVTEPLMGPLRRVLPALRLGRVSLDLSPIVLIIGLRVLGSIIC